MNNIYDICPVLLERFSNQSRAPSPFKTTSNWCFHIENRGMHKQINAKQMSRALYRSPSIPGSEAISILLLFAFICEENPCCNAVKNPKSNYILFYMYVYIDTEI